MDQKKMKRKRRKAGDTILFAVLFLAGILLFFYPSISDYWNQFHQSIAIAGYTDAVNSFDEEKVEKLREEAQRYNEELLLKQDRYLLSEEDEKRYQRLLDITGTGIMSRITIPSIHVILPVYHGIDEATLQIAAGHVPGTSLPVGGPSTHCVLSGHTGLPSARLFTDLRKLKEGDVFELTTLGKTMTYEIDQILTVLPTETKPLDIEQGKDYCTLITCTPYGINSHRLLVRGKRILKRKHASLAKGKIPAF